MLKEVSPHVNSDELERSLLLHWEKNAIFQKSLEQNRRGPLFTFYDGPPYATGKPHYGHILQSAIKDTVLRYKTMQGYFVPRRVGWDCHGLPVEVLVEKELGIKSKKEIEVLGIEKFNAACREVVFRYIKDFTETLQRIGRWASYDNAYATLETPYIESEWWIFKKLWEHDLIYKAFKSNPYCVRCATPLSHHEVTMAYKDKTDKAVYVLLPLRGADQQFLLIWTTTPWTLPGNSAVAFNPALTYVTAVVDGKQVVVTKDRVKQLFGEVAIVKTWRPDELEKLQYEAPYSEGTRIVAADYVTATEGTGLVHIAPAFGEEDFALSKKYDLPVLRTVNADGRFGEEVKTWAGQTIFEANARIIEDLKERGLLWREEDYTHSYPFCWRCDSPLIYYALDTWFVKVEALKQRLKKLNEEIHWIPEHVKQGRFGRGLESAPDWAVSRNRYWSVPMPIWECDRCGDRVVVGNVEELKKLSGKTDIPDLHRPYVDEITWRCGKCGAGTLRRVPEVLDVWFDAGSMPYAQWHYPFENKELVEKGFPADFIAESIEMTRAWFYFLHVIAGALTTSDIGLGKDKPAFKHAIASGLIFAEDGQKLSKKLKNYPEIEPTLKKYGADVLRFYLLVSTSLGEPYRFSEKDLNHFQRSVYMTLWNVYSFFTRYARIRGWTQPSPSLPGRQAGLRRARAAPSDNLLDRWILVRLKQLEQTVIQSCEAYQVDTAGRAFLPFIDDLSNWYVRRSRSRFQPAGESEEANGAFATLYEVLVRLTKLLASFMPFVTEEIYRTLTGTVSVHLEQLPKVEEIGEIRGEEKQLFDDMAAVRQVVASALALRAGAKIKVRQPLSRLVVFGPTFSDELAALVKDEVNVKEVVFEAPRDTGSSGLTVELNTELTPELKAEGIAREIIRHGQTLRKQAGYGLSDRIELYVAADKIVQESITKQRDMVMKALQADRLREDDGRLDARSEVMIDGKSVVIGVARV